MKRINPFISRVLQYTFTVTAAYSITMLLKSKFDFIEMLEVLGVSVVIGIVLSALMSLIKR